MRLNILAIIKNQDAMILADKLLKTNPEIDKLQKEFQFQEGSLILYDVNLPKNTWVIMEVDNKPMDRKFNKWPLISGEF